MSISEEILRIQTDRNTIRTKLVDLGLAASTADLDDCAAAVDGIENRGAVSANVVEGATYTIPKGYHNGSGTVSGVKGGGNYTLQSKSITPTKAQQNVTPDSGYYGLSDVTVGAIPENFHDVSPVTAGATDVLANKIIVDSTGKSIAGTMPNNGTVEKTLDTETTEYTIPKGYHSGSGKVSILTEALSVTPMNKVLEVAPADGKVLSKVTVAAIPYPYFDVSQTTATIKDVRSGKKFRNSEGGLATGAMTENLDGTTIIGVGAESYTIPEGYHSGNGVVMIQPQSKTVTPTKSEQTITPNTGGVLSEVIVEAIPDAYIETSDADAVAGNILSGKTAYVNGVKLTGTMKNNGSVGSEIDGLTITSVIIPAGYTTGGTVSLTDDIEVALAAI